MPAIAMGIGFLGYTVGLWGYALLRGYNVSLGSLLSPTHPPTWASISGSQIPSSQVFPSGGAASTNPVTGKETGNPGLKAKKK